MSAPLTPLEVKAGLARLNAARFMAWNHEYQDEPGGYIIGDAASDFIFELAPKLSDTFDAEHGIPTDQDISSIIQSLAFALVLSRLAHEDVFRLGTSEEALRLFTEKGDWRPTARLAS
jgi:hypothetical protein